MIATNQIDMTAIGEALAEEFMLANIRIGAWSGKFKDHAAAAEIAAEDVNRRFFPGKLGEGFATINTMLSKARSSHYAMTLPWTVVDKDSGERRTGPRLLPSSALFDHAAVIAKAESELPVLLDAIEEGYSALVAQAAAEANQGKFDESFYPTFDEIRSRYTLHRDYSPVPVPTDFKRMGALDGRVVEKMMQRMLSSQHEMVQNAVEDLWSRTVEAVEHFAERLEDDENGGRKRLFDSMHSSVMDLADQLVAFKMTDDPAVGEIHTRIQTVIGERSIKDLKKDDTLRRQVRREVLSLVATMRAKA